MFGQYLFSIFGFEVCLLPFFWRCAFFSINSDDRVSLSALLSSVSSSDSAAILYTYQWKAIDSGMDLSPSSPMISTSARSAKLVILPGAMLSGGVYTFAVRIYSPIRPVFDFVESRVTLSINRAPVNGRYGANYTLNIRRGIDDLIMSINRVPVNGRYGANNTLNIRRGIYDLIMTCTCCCVCI